MGELFSSLGTIILPTFLFLSSIRTVVLLQVLVYHCERIAISSLSSLSGQQKDCSAAIVASLLVAVANHYEYFFVESVVLSYTDLNCSGTPSSNEWTDRPADRPRRERERVILVPVRYMQQ